MFKKYFQKISWLLLCLIVLSFVLANSALALPLLKSTSTAQQQQSAFQTSAGYGDMGNEGIVTIISTIISIVLGLLGIIFLVLIIYSGYQWLTAGGNEEAVKNAQSRLKNAIIGLLIVILAYAITAFVFTQLSAVSGGGAGNLGGTSGVN